MRALLLCSIWMALSLTTLALKGDWACQEALCIAALSYDDLIHYELSTTLDDLGWVAVGFGQSMVNTHSVILWKNPTVNGSIVLSQRYADAYAEPHVVASPPRVATLVDTKGLLPAPPLPKSSQSSLEIFSFQVPVEHASSDPIKPHVFALSYTSPKPHANGDLSDPSMHLFMHHHAGYIELDFSKEFVASSSPPKGAVTVAAEDTRLENLIRIHATLASFGFLVLLPLGSLFARYCRAFMTSWLPYHWKTNFLVAGPIITVGVLLGPIIVFSKETYRIHFANGHELIGILLLIAYYLQVLLGRYIHDRRVKLARIGPITHPHPPLNILHIVFGVSIVTTAFCQVRTGLQWWEILTGKGPITSWALPVWRAWIPILFLVYFGGYALIRRQFRLELEAAAGGYRPVATEGENGHGQSTPLLGPNELETEVP